MYTKVWRLKTRSFVNSVNGRGLNLAHA